MMAEAGCPASMASRARQWCTTGRTPLASAISSSTICTGTSTSTTSALAVCVTARLLCHRVRRIPFPQCRFLTAVRR